MIYYLNRGFIVEQALADLINKYFHQLKLDEVYSNFHITITNDHPFAHLILHNDATNTADMFPSIVVTTQNEEKTPDMAQMQQQSEIIKLEPGDFEYLSSLKRVKTIIQDDGTEKEVTKKGEKVYENIPGYCFVADEKTLNELKEISQERDLYGVSFTTRRRDKISIEIWADNNQLKNEIYEQLKLFLTSAFDDVFSKTYKLFSPSYFDNTLQGERSNNFNLDFDIPLYGSHISFDIDYNEGQILVDTEIKQVTYNTIWEVINHVKESKYIE